MSNELFLVSVSAHLHSSLSKNVPDHLKDFFPEFPKNPGNKSDWKVKIIWKSVGQDPVLILSPFNNQVWFPNTVHPVATTKKNNSGPTWVFNLLSWILRYVLFQVVRGEANIVRYLARCLEETSSVAAYEKLSPGTSLQQTFDHRGHP